MVEIIINPSIARKQTVAATPGEVNFPYDFPVFDEADLVVLHQRGVVITEWVLTTDYTVTGIGTEAGGNVVANAGQNTGDIVTVIRATPLERLTDFQQRGEFRSKLINLELDEIWMAMQEAARETSRSIKLDAADSDTQQLVLPPASGWTDGHVLTFNGGALEVSDEAFTTQVALSGANAAAAAASAAAALVSETNADASELLAQQWATEVEDTPVTAGAYSALHWAAKAAAVVATVLATTGNFTTLKAIPAGQLQETALIQVRGHTVVGDAGIGIFKSTQTNPGADDGGTILHSDAAGWYFVRVFDNVFRPGFFGIDETGATETHVAMQAMFDAVTDGTSVQFTPGANYLLGVPVTTLDKYFTVFAYGATFKMSAGSTYNAFLFSGTSSGTSHAEMFGWYGGIFDGNKDEQNWPDIAGTVNPYVSNDDTWDQTYGNCGLLGIRYFKTAVVEDVHIINKVSDGSVMTDCLNMAYTRCTERNGVPFNYSIWLAANGTGHQSSAFKARSNSETSTLVGQMVCTDCRAQDGSIGFQFSTPNGADAPPNSVFHLRSCISQDNVQNGVLVEHCKTVILNTLDLIASTLSAAASNTVDIGNGTEYFHGTKIRGLNSQIDLRNGTKLIEGTLSKSILEYTSVTGTLADAVISVLKADDVKVYCNNLVDYGFTVVEAVNCHVEDAVLAGYRGLFKSAACKAVDCTTGMTNVRGPVIAPEISGGDYGMDFNASLPGEVRGGKISGQTLNPMNVGNISSVSVMGTHFKDWGTNTGASGYNRAAIGGNTSLGALADNINLQGCIFERSGAVADAYTQAVYANQASGADTYRKGGCHEIGMTTANTVQGSYTKLFDDVYLNTPQAATTPGTVTNKLRVFDSTGALVGYVPIYDAIT